MIHNMKRTFTFGLLLIITLILSCCSSVKTEGWPEKATGNGYIITKTDDSSAGLDRMLSYIDVTDEEKTKAANLIVTATITNDPIYYKYGYEKLDYYNVIKGFNAKIDKVYYTDYGVKEGELLNFLRSEGSESIVTHAQKGSTYVLFLQRNENNKQKGYIPWHKITEYSCRGPNYNIIEWSTNSDSQVEALVKQYK